MKKELLKGFIFRNCLDFEPKPASHRKNIVTSGYDFRMISASFHFTKDRISKIRIFRSFVSISASQDRNQEETEVGIQTNY